MITVSVLQMWRSRCHDCQDGCICTKKKDSEGYVDVVVDPECSVRGHSESVSSVGFSLDGQRIVSGSHDKLVKIWDAETRAVVRRLVGARCVAEVFTR